MCEGTGDQGQRQSQTEFPAECGTGAIHIGRIVNLEAKQRGYGVWVEGRCCLSIHVCSVRWMQHGLWHLCRHECRDSETEKVWEAVGNIEDVTENRGSRGGWKL